MSRWPWRAARGTWRNFDQVGELLNVWLYGHELAFSLQGVPSEWRYQSTKRTFSEHMAIERIKDDQEARVNRLVDYKPPIGRGQDDDPFDPLHAVPDLPAFRFFYTW